MSNYFTSESAAAIVTNPQAGDVLAVNQRERHKIINATADEVTLLTTELGRPPWEEVLGICVFRQRFGHCLSVGYRAAS